MIRRTLQLCRHEAAHAVTCELMGGRVAWVKVFKRLTKQGASAMTVLDLRRIPRSIAAAFICVAGDCQDQLGGYRDEGTSSWGDGLTAKKAGFTQFDVGLLQAPLRAWLKQPHVRRSVEAVARELQRKDLKGDDVRRIIRREERRAKKGKKHG